MSVKEEIGQIITDAQVEIAALQARVKELEAEVFEWQSMQHNKEIIRLHKVVDAARECYPALLEIDAKGVTINLGVALRELDGEKK